MSIRCSVCTMGLSEKFKVLNASCQVNQCKIPIYCCENCQVPEICIVHAERPHQCLSRCTAFNCEIQKKKLPLKKNVEEKKIRKIVKKKAKLFK